MPKRSGEAATPRRRRWQNAEERAASTGHWGKNATPRQAKPTYRYALNSSEALLYEHATRRGSTALQLLNVRDFFVVRRFRVSRSVFFRIG